MMRMIRELGATIAANVGGRGAHQDRRDLDFDKRLGIKRDIPKIRCATGPAALKEFTEFEDRLREFRLREGEKWVLAFEASLEDKAKTWRDFLLMVPRVREMYAGLFRPNTTDDQYLEYYRLMRFEIMQRNGLVYENPGEEAKEAWDQLRCPERLDHQEDMDDFISESTEKYTALVKAGMHTVGDRGDERQILMDLSKKIPRGTPFRIWLFSELNMRQSGLDTFLASQCPNRVMG